MSSNKQQTDFQTLKLSKVKAIVPAKRIRGDLVAQLAATSVVTMGPLCFATLLGVTAPALCGGEPGASVIPLAKSTAGTGIDRSLTCYLGCFTGTVTHSLGF